MGAKAIILDFASWTTCHGLSHIGSSHGFILKSIWTIIVLAATAIFALQLYNVICEYLAYEVNTVTSIVFQDISFPAVTICNFNPFVYSELLKSSKADAVKSMFSDYNLVMNGKSPRNDIWGFATADPLVTPQKAKENLVYIASTLSETEKLSTVVSLGEMVAECNYNLNDCNLTTGGDDFLLRFDSSYGNCYTFNYNQKFRSTIAGPVYGLRLVLRDNQTEYMPIQETSGFRILVHSPDEVPFPMTAGYNVPLGFATSIAVSFLTEERLPDPYGRCTDVEATPSSYYYDGNYTVEGCYRSCYQDRVIDACDCCDPRFNCPTSANKSCPLPFPSHADSDVLLKFRCMLNVSERVETSFDPAVECDCPQKCNDKTYSVTISNALWPAQNYVPAECNNPNSHWKGNLSQCHQWYSENTALVEIYYETLIYQDYNQVPRYPIVTLVSDIGGNLGLLMGCSLVTAVEFLCLFALLISSCCKARKSSGSTPLKTKAK